MASTDRLLGQAEPWLRANARDVVRVLLPLPVLCIAWWIITLQFRPVTTLGLMLYALVNLALIGAISHAYNRQFRTTHTTLLLLSVLSDGLLALWLFFAAGPLTMSIYPFYLIMGLKALCYRHRFLWVLFVPAMLGPCYLATLYLEAKPTVQALSLTTQQPITYWGLLGGTGLFVLLALALGEQRLRETQRLLVQIDQKENGYRARVDELESINIDLRVRIRRQQALEESLRAITNSLSLDDVLNQILDSMLQMLGLSRISAAALSLLNGNSFTHRTLTLDPNMPTSWADLLAQQIVARPTPVVINDSLQEREWREIYRAGVVSALSVPLIDIDGVLRGALTVVSQQRHTFTSTETRHLTSFSIQAGVAIHNAELHAKLAHQRMMLEAVLRDIHDGLVVVGEDGAIVMANPMATEALQYSATGSGGLWEQIDRLAQDMRTNNKAMLSRELRTGSNQEEPERVYQAHASLVHIPKEETSHAAIVLHDITSSKAIERARIEFISMVSHELRNPLNTLNGFLKVVLQGKAGSLNELQQEFLGLADSQAEQLKGRITELLEFNRLEAGRLRLNPQWSSLADLVLMTYARFQIHAEQAGLSMTLELPNNIPDILMDSERIGQVLTNLIENAMKATSAGGQIAIGVEVCDSEARIFVRDTGVGIAKEHQNQIFDRFYRVEQKRTSQHGVHLGLGLSICQQIVEDHHGRIWVDSELGKGSMFVFTLPFVAQEQPVNELQVS